MLERLPRRPCLLIFNYHRIADGRDDPYDPGLIEATPDQFDEQMRTLKKHYALTELAEAQKLVDHPERLRHCRVLVTLDDGYRDNHDVAFPIRGRTGSRRPFPRPGFVGTNRVPWWDQVAYLVRRTEKQILRIGYPSDRIFTLDDSSRLSVIHALLSLYKSHETNDSERFLAGVEEACGVARPREANDRLFMSWEEAGTLVKGGMSIGSHTHDHELLAKLSPEQQLRQCQLSRETISQELGLNVDAFAYPVGSRGSFSEVTRRCLRETGYRTAFSYYGGVNTRSEAISSFDVNRVAVAGPADPSHFRLRTALAVVTARDLW